MFEEAADDLPPRILSDRPGTPGLRQQMPRMTRSMRTPAWLALYRQSIICESTSD